MTEPLPDSDATGAGRRLRRDPEHGVVAGVLSGLAARIDADPLLVRIAFVVLVVLTGGLALAAYALGWAALPGRPEARLSSGPVVAAGPDGGRRRRGRLALGVGLLTLAVLLSFRELGLWWSDALAWPLVLAASGAA
ncbi:MAG: PspC domain-containing protein, partial [Thermoleophilia bacterium]|nr:PspC domain-containing protein [Thermoleophilia bacterium]